MGIRLSHIVCEKQRLKIVFQICRIFPRIFSSDECMQTPLSTTCTTSANGAASSLPATVAAKCDTTTCNLLQTCMTTPADAACTITDSTSVPVKVTNLDKCMTSIDDSTCAASYGVTGNLVSSGGSGMVGWIQQFSKFS